MSDPMMKMLSDIRKEQLSSSWSTIFKDKIIGLVSVNIAILGWVLSLISSSPSTCVLIAAWVILVLDALTIVSFWKTGSKIQDVVTTEMVTFEWVKNEDQDAEAVAQKMLRNAKAKQEQKSEEILHRSIILFSITVGLCLGLLVFLSVF